MHRCERANGGLRRRRLVCEEKFVNSDRCAPVCVGLDTDWTKNKALPLSARALARSPSPDRRLNTSQVRADEPTTSVRRIDGQTSLRQRQRERHSQAESRRTSRELSSSQPNELRALARRRRRQLQMRDVSHTHTRTHAKTKQSADIDTSRKRAAFFFIVSFVVVVVVSLLSLCCL